MKTIQFEGKTVSYDERAPKRFTVQRALVSVEKDPVGYYEALDAIFGGPEKANEVAEMFDDDSAKVFELLHRISLAVGEQAKN